MSTLFVLLCWCCSFNSATQISTFWESVCFGSSSTSLETMMLVLDVGLVGSLVGLASLSVLLHAGISWEECGLLDSSSSEVRLWSLMLSVISCSFCLSCCSSKSTSSHWGRGEVLFGVGGAWLVCRNRAEDMCLRKMFYAFSKSLYFLSLFALRCIAWVKASSALPRWFSTDCVLWLSALCVKSMSHCCHRYHCKL